MRTPWRLLIVFIALCAATGLAQDMKITSPLTSLVDAESMFARTSADHGVDSAFMAFLADDAIIFRPHPVNGQEWFRSHPGSPILLTWVPGFADVSVTGDLGYTTGPWMARDRRDTTAPPAYGEFVTIWKKKGNAWKVELDLGISHSAPAKAVHFAAPADKGGPSVFVRPDSGFRAAEWAKLRACEQEVFGDSLHPVPVATFLFSLSPDASVLRPGRFPVMGSDSISDFLGSQAGQIFRRSLGGDLSRGGDLGHTYGAYHVRVGDGLGEREGYYLTVWKKEREGGWKIVLDLESLIPGKQH
jgi:ketosteroid isomerase-like protein